MPETSHVVDGKKNLPAQQDMLNFMEQFAASKLIAYGESPRSTADLKRNNAVLMPVPFGQQPPPLELIAVAAGTDLAKVISDQVSQGKIIVFHEICWVDNEETPVVGVRKAS